MKNQIRKRILAQRDALGAVERRALSDRIASRLLALDGYRAAQCVAAYMSFGSEFDTAAVIADLLAHRRRLVLPKVERGSRFLKFYHVTNLERDLASGVWGIREPRIGVCGEAAPEEIDFVLVPGVAFTRRCERLGYGRGFYDRLIASFAGRPALVAAAYTMQVVAELPTSESDQRVDLVVTEDAEYKRRES